MGMPLQELRLGDRAVRGAVLGGVTLLASLVVGLGISVFWYLGLSLQNGELAEAVAYRQMLGECVRMLGACGCIIGGVVGLLGGTLMYE